MALSTIGFCTGLFIWDKNPLFRRQVVLTIYYGGAIITANAIICAHSVYVLNKEKPMIQLELVIVKGGVFASIIAGTLVFRFTLITQLSGISVAI